MLKRGRHVSADLITYDNVAKDTKDRWRTEEMARIEETLEGFDPRTEP